MPTKTLSLVDGKTTLKKLAGRPFTSVGDFWKVMGTVAGDHLPCLRKAVDTIWGEKALDVAENIRKAALTVMDELPVMPALEDGEGTAVVMITRAEARRLLALSFFDKFPTMEDKDTHWGSLSWISLYRQPFPVSVARLQCLLHYFQATSHDGWESTAAKHPPIGFYRVREEGDIDWGKCTGNLPEVVFSSEMRIEDRPEAGCHVDFANKNLQIHKIIPSATQEEVLFSVRPELMLSLPLYSTLLNDEAAVMTGAAMYCDYTGYLDTFTFAEGVVPEEKPPAVIAIDAVVAPKLQYRTQQLDRDIRKAYAGFSSGAQKSLKPGISTGNWGCGAFGGDVALKFCQQLIAAAHAGVPTLYYSTFKNPALEERLKSLLGLLCGMEVTPAALYTAIQGYSGESNALLGMEVLAYHLPKSSFEEFLRERLMKMRAEDGAGGGGGTDDLV